MPASPPAKFSALLPSSACISLTIHQVQNEAEFVGGVEGVGHTHYKGTVLEGKEQSNISGNKQSTTQRS